MSSNVPPGGPRDPGGQPEYLESGRGRPIDPAPGSDRPRAGRRTAWVAAGAVGVLAVAGIGGWAAWSFLSSGPQPAEALPDSTIAYASIDLDPSGAQKIEALRTLRKFPAFKDHVGLGTDDDVRERIFEEVQGSCPDLDYGADVEPWLGDRLAVAAVDAGGDTPEAVFVLQVSDEDAADRGLQKIKECAGGDEGAWHIGDGWALVGQSQDVVDRIADDAADAPLSDDEDFSHWTGEAGDPGIATAYLAPQAGDLLAEHARDWFGYGMPVGYTDSMEATSYVGPDVPSEALDALKDFGGLAATVRFDDGSLELEVAGDAGANASGLDGFEGADGVLESLPGDTAAAVGTGFTDGWFGDLVEQLASSTGQGSAEDLMDQLAEATGLDLPDDAETLAGDSAALAIGSDFDPDTFASSSDGSDVPIGLKVQGDADGIEAVLDKLRPQLGSGAGVLDSDSDGDVVAVGPDADYRAELLEDGDLGSSEVFGNVVREADQAAAILFVDFDAGDGWMARAAGEDDPEAAANLEPLEGLGMSAWLDDEVGHVVLRVTTD